jgi:hypothetical protein
LVAKSAHEDASCGKPSSRKSASRAIGRNTKRWMLVLRRGCRSRHRWSWKHAAGRRIAGLLLKQ